jgi:hypothetical protein
MDGFVHGQLTRLVLEQPPASEQVVVVLGEAVGLVADVFQQP